MLKEIKRYILENKTFFIILLINSFVFYPIGEIYDIQSKKLTWVLMGFLYEYTYILNISMILNSKKILEKKVVMIIFFLTLGINYFFINNMDFIKIWIAMIFNVIFGILHASILINNYKETLNIKSKGELLVVSLFCSNINGLIMLMYGLILKLYSELNIKSINFLMMLLPYTHMFPVTILLISRLKDIKKERKAIILSLSITILVYMILRLIDIDNIIVLISLFSILYLALRDRGVGIDRKYMVGYISIFLTIVGYSYIKKDNKSWIRVDNYYDDEKFYYYEDNSLEEPQKSGIYYKKIDGGKMICGEVIDGKKEGRWINWYPDNKKLIEGIYKDGKRDGRWIEWYENGGKKSEGIYKKGKKEGKWIYWYKNGEKKSEGIYKEGEEIGKWIEWNKFGKKKETLYEEIKK